LPLEFVGAEHDLSQDYSTTSMKISRLCLVMAFCSCLVSASCSDIHVLKKSEANSTSSSEVEKNDGETNDSEVEMAATVPPDISTELPSETTLEKLPVLAQTPVLQDYCRKIDKKFSDLKWGKSFCQTMAWHHVRNSVKGDPLFWVTFGEEELTKNLETEVTMIMCGVHGDEITPIKFCFDIIHHLQTQNPELFKNRFAIVAPIVNPDSFFSNSPSRTNANGVDINRNFPTADWKARAVKLWKSWYSSDKRRNPGTKPLSEPEVLFQINLIKRYNPDKILSVHAPLTILDYDGPQGMDKDLRSKKIGKMANELLIQMSQKANGYRVKNYPFFPGSLGNWAGNERNIPTYTLELPTSDPSKTQEYWQLFKEAIMMALTSPLRINQPAATDEASSDEGAKVTKEL
jgi:protein MpaA